MGGGYQSSSVHHAVAAATVHLTEHLGKAASKWRFGTPLPLEPPVLLYHQGVQWYSTLTQQGAALYNHKPSQPDQISRATTSPTPNSAS
ncbi:uncharacterized [Tachysurus ichikawai]